MREDVLVGPARVISGAWSSEAAGGSGNGANWRSTVNLGSISRRSQSWISSAVVPRCWKRGLVLDAQRLDNGPQGVYLLSGISTSRYLPVRASSAGRLSH